MRLSILTLTCFLVCFFHAGAQQSTVIDSLEERLESESDEQSKVDLLNTISRQYGTSELEKSEEFGRRALELATQIDYPKGQVAAYFNIGNRFYLGGDYSQTLENYLAALRILEKEGDKRGQANALMGIGNVMGAQRDMDGAIEYQMKSLAINKEIGDSLGMAGNYNNLGSTYMEMKEYEKALQHHFRSKEIKEAMGNYRGMSSSYGNIGIIYELQGKYDKALEYQEKAYAIRKDLNNKKGQVMSHTDIGKILAATGKYDKAIERLTEGKELAEEVGFGDGLRGALKTLSEVYEEKGDHAKALAAYREFHTVNDSLFNLRTSKEIAEMEAVYDNEKKARKIQLLEKDNQLQEKNAKLQKAELRRQRYLIAGSALSLVFAVFGIYTLVRRNRLKQKLNRELEGRNVEITEKNAIIEERNKDITDSIEYAKTIQRSLLPARDVFGNHFREHFILYKPRDIVSGDFYWGHHTGERTIIIVADCTGHGVPGSLLSMLGQNMLNQIVIDQEIYDPGEILTQLNTRIHNTLNKRGDKRIYDGMDISVLSVDGAASKVKWASANHRILIYDGTELKRLEGDRKPIGGRTDKGFQFTCRSVGWQGQPTFYLFSDGYVDQFGGSKGKKLKLSNFEKLLLKIIQNPLQEQREALVDHFEDWKSEFEQIDDVCILGVRL